MKEREEGLESDEPIFLARLDPNDEGAGRSLEPDEPTVGLFLAKVDPTNEDEMDRMANEICDWVKANTAKADAAKKRA